MSTASSIRNGIVFSFGLALALPGGSRADETLVAVTRLDQASGTAKGDEKSGQPAEKKKSEADQDKAEPEGWHREGFALKNGKNKIELVGYIQEDFRNYDWSVQGDETGIQEELQHELRRFRIGAKARFGNLSFEFVADPRSAPSELAADERTDYWKQQLKDATVGYDFAKQFNVLVGHFKPNVSQEFLTSASKTDFVERTMIASRLAPDRDWGVGAEGELGRVTYSLGVFQGDGDADAQTAGTSGVVRLAFKVSKGFSIAGSFMQGDVTADPKEGTREPSPKGAAGQTASSFTFWNRAHVNGTRRRIGGDLSYSRGPFRLQAEYLQNQEQRLGQGSTGQDIPDVRGRGWSAQASYLLTGEKKVTTVTPAKSIFQGGKGALEVVARIDELKFDDTGDQSGFAGYGNRARNISPSGATALQAGLNYWASNFMKLQTTAVWESYNDPLIAPVPGKSGKYFTLFARVQFMIP